MVDPIASQHMCKNRMMGWAWVVHFLAHIHFLFSNLLLAHPKRPHGGSEVGGLINQKSIWHQL